MTPAAARCRGWLTERRCSVIHDYMSTEIARTRGWFTGRLPDGWFSGPAEVIVDREEITVVGTLPEPDGRDERRASRRGRGGSSGSARTPAQRRIEIAREAERKFEQEGLLGRALRRRSRDVHHALGPGHDPAAPVRAPGARHARRRRRRPQPQSTRSPGVCGWSASTRTWLAELRDALRRVEAVRAAGTAKPNRPAAERHPSYCNLTNRLGKRLSASARVGIPWDSPIASFILKT